MTNTPTRLTRAAGLGAEPGADKSGRRPVSAVRLARMAGLLYLVVAIFGGFAQIVRVTVYEPGDAAATAAKIVANATLVRLSFVADLVQALVWLVLAVTLYRLLAHWCTLVVSAASDGPLMHPRCRRVIALLA
jgi:hypothetical protein